MTKRITTWLSGVALIGLLVLVPWLAIQSPEAQTALNTTTLAAAVSNVNATTVTLTSGSTVAAGQVLFVDKELMLLSGAIGGTTTQWNVVRGYDGTASATHASGTQVWTGARERFARSDVSGSCSDNASTYSPRINVVSGRVFDCLNNRWTERVIVPVRLAGGLVVSGAYGIRDDFNQGYLVMQDDGTAQSVTDAEENFVYGSPLGAIEFREEQTKTVSSWLVINGSLDISGDNTTTAEGVEIVFMSSSDAAVNQVLEVGTNGGCIAGMFTVADISGVDELVFGWRQNEAFKDAILYETYGDYAIIGLQDNAGDLDVEDEEAGAGVQNDDVGVTWADGERRGLKVCISTAGAPSFFYTAASPDAVFPVWIPVATANTGDPLTVGDGLVPFLGFLITGTDGPDVTIQWIEFQPNP